MPSFALDGALPCMYSGFLDSNAAGSHHLFYWMFRTNDPNGTAPLVVWINGGPGSSSMFGNFLENGPLIIEENKTENVNGTYEFLVYNNPQGSWANEAHLIFIDQPVNTCFSYSDVADDYLTSMDQVSEEFVQFMLNLFLEYPDLQDRDLFLTGESYGGKYLPVFSNALLDVNTNGNADNATFNLKATLVGDPYTAPVTQRTNTYLVPYALNVIDVANLPQVSALIRRCEEMVHHDISTAADYCSDIVGYVGGVSGGVFPYDNRIFGYDWDPIEQPVNDYFNKSKNPDI